MAEQIKQLYEFGLFRVDPVKRLLVREGEVISLKPKVFETLLVLLERRARVVEKEELMQLLWPDSFVEENNLSVNVSALRRALGEGGEHRYIVTLPGRGYRFVAEVREVTEGEAELMVRQSKVRVIVEEEERDEGVKGWMGEGVMEGARSLTASPSHLFTR